MLERANAHRLRRALEHLPPEFREVIVLRELEGVSYNEIADLVAIPVDTVMSPLARGRQRLQRLLMNSEKERASRWKFVRSTKWRTSAMRSPRTQGARGTLARAIGEGVTRIDSRRPESRSPLTNPAAWAGVKRAPSGCV